MREAEPICATSVSLQEDENRKEMVRGHEYDLRTSLLKCVPQGVGDGRSDAKDGCFYGVGGRWRQEEMVPVESTSEDEEEFL